jgi:hypothetical protein
MEGGLGNDTIVMTSSFDDPVGGGYDRILEFGYEGDPTNGGIDWVIYNGGEIDLKDVYTDANFNGVGTTQRDFVENGMFIENLQGSNISGQILYGNWLNNTIIGEEGSDDIDGEFGNDYLANFSSKSTTIDTLTGGAGSDTFSLAEFLGTAALYAGDGTCALGAIDNSYAYITDFNNEDNMLRPTILPDLNRDGQGAKGFDTFQVADPHNPGSFKTGLYIDDIIINAGIPVHTYNLIAIY